MTRNLEKEALLTHRPLSLTMGETVMQRNADGEHIAREIVRQWNPKLGRKVVAMVITLDWGLGWL